MVYNMCFNMYIFNLIQVKVKIKYCRKINFIVFFNQIFPGLLYNFSSLFSKIYLKQFY